MSESNGPKFKLRWDGTVSAGHVLIAIPPVVLGLAFVLQLAGAISREAAVRHTEIAGLSEQQAADMASIAGQLDRLSSRVDILIRRLPNSQSRRAQ